ncbi:MAG: carboxypeptidase-like regulatory domain-containing protein [Acidobacteriota bacterium]|nr:carboxypeptidase-like regulatory domain-containing protein [Acidobacteriota bacterium]
MSIDHKRHHIALVLGILLSFALDASAQSGTGRVTGRVLEARTGAPLVAVLVKVQSTKQQAFSDLDGRFEIADVPLGPQTLLVSVVGFGLVRRDVIVVSGEAVDISIPVAEGASTYVEDVAVSGTSSAKQSRAWRARPC